MPFTTIGANEPDESPGATPRATRRVARARHTRIGLSGERTSPMHLVEPEHQPPTYRGKPVALPTQYGKERLLARVLDAALGFGPTMI